VKSLPAAISFLTRLPVGRFIIFDSGDVARSAGWLPLVGAMLGAVYAGAAILLKGHLPAGVIAVLLVILDAVATGALHFDGLADTCDGFGGGKDKEDILRIMRDHAIGSYGGAALALLIALKVMAFAGLLGQANYATALILIAALGRWSILLLTAALPYARPTPSVPGAMGKWALVWGSVSMIVGLALANAAKAWMAGASVVVVTAAFGWFCRRRIGGITGDTLGAGVELCESAALLTFLWTAYPG
jgi:cobalamin 5'-phosphate synthase/cobalamin synthase